MRVGWQDDNTRVYGCLLHMEIKGGKIWIQEDGGEDAIADQLVALGVPTKDIVLGYHAPHVRQHTEFAVGWSIIFSMLAVVLWYLFTQFKALQKYQT